VILELVLAAIAAFAGAWLEGWRRRRYAVTAESHVSMYCPSSGELVATDWTEPAAWGDDGDVAIYSCPHCERGKHVFYLGAPTPLLVDDVFPEVESL
jgi:hypothetical protein